MKTKHLPVATISSRNLLSAQMISLLIYLLKNIDLFP